MDKNSGKTAGRKVCLRARLGVLTVGSRTGIEKNIYCKKPGNLQQDSRELYKSAWLTKLLGKGSVNK